jgi:hypothetical protein
MLQNIPSAIFSFKSAYNYLNEYTFTRISFWNGSNESFPLTIAFFCKHMHLIEILHGICTIWILGLLKLIKAHSGSMDIEPQIHQFNKVDSVTSRMTLNSFWGIKKFPYLQFLSAVNLTFCHHRPCTYMWSGDSLWHILLKYDVGAVLGQISQILK